MVSCGASGSTWEAVAPTNPQGSGGGLVIAQRGPTTPWATTTSAYSSHPQQRPRIVGTTKGGTSFPIRGVSWLPISGADHPIVVSTGGGGGPPQGIYVQIAAGRYQAATGTGPLFGGTGPATIVYHGIAFGSGGSGWLYADVVPVPTSAFAPSSMPSSPASYQVVVCHTTDGGATWSTVTCHPPPSWDHPSATSMGPPRPRSCRPTLMLPDRIVDVKQPACATEERAVAIGRRAGASEALLPLRDDRARAP